MTTRNRNVFVGALVALVLAVLGAVTLFNRPSPPPVDPTPEPTPTDPIDDIPTPTPIEPQPTPDPDETPEEPTPEPPSVPDPWNVDCSDGARINWITETYFVMKVRDDPFVADNQTGTLGKGIQGIQVLCVYTPDNNNRWLYIETDAVKGWVNEIFNGAVHMRTEIVIP